MKILVCGGRFFSNRDHIFDALDSVHRTLWIDLVIHGGAPGADRIAGDWAIARGLAIRVFPADWDTYRSAAGPIRNRQMLAEGKPGLVIAFEGGKGTANMIEQARRAGVSVRVM